MSQWVRHIKLSKFSSCGELLSLLSAALIIYWFFSKFGLSTGCLNSNKYGMYCCNIYIGALCLFLCKYIDINCAICTTRSKFTREHPFAQQNRSNIFLVAKFWRNCRFYCSYQAYASSLTISVHVLSCMYKFGCGHLC